MFATAAMIAVFATAVLWWLPRRGHWLAAALVGGGLVVANATQVAPSPLPPPEQRPAIAAGGGYVGSGTCRSCHPGEHASWHGSFHRTMTQLATRAAVVPDFERLQLDWFGSPAVLEWRGDRLWTSFTRGGRRPGRVERPIEQLTGSHHLQVFWYSTGEGRELGPFPLAYKIEERIWLPLTTVFVLPPESRDPPEPGAWNQSCAMCHTTHPEPRVDIGRNDTQVAELGIACESCHGPGEAHVAANQNPLRRYAARFAGRDDTVVNPAALAPVRSAQVCGHCHSVSILREQHFDAWREHGSPFRPGQDLQATHRVIELGDRDLPELRRDLQENPNFFASSFWSDGEVRLSGREFSGLRRSPCYTHGDPARQLDCTSCHEMHPDDGSSPAAWQRGQMRPSATGNAACTQCHEALAEPAALSAHTHHAPDSIGSRCYDCHMPHTSVGLMKSSRSHAITSPDVAVELATGRPNACNLCHLDRTLQWTAEQLQQRWGIAAPALDAEQRRPAAGVKWLLTGDAGLRLLATAAAGGAAAQATAGTDWLSPYLARLLDDPYYVVRFAAARSLRTFAPSALAADYDFLAPAEVARRFGADVERQWQPPIGAARARPELLLGPAGLDRAEFARLFARRDDRKVYLAE
ncbi:MAG: C cytochrome precursor [Planctomycetes bacterium]|jgi:hypothetical protein|nr:C cytochrome precursor [Planctomycetota bacterium]